MLDIGGDVLRRLQRVLVRAGVLEGPREGWDDVSAAALRELAGTVNLEERLLGDERVDRVVLRYLEEKYPG